MPTKGKILLYFGRPKLRETAWALAVNFKKIKTLFSHQKPYENLLISPKVDSPQLYADGRSFVSAITIKEANFLNNLTSILHPSLLNQFYNSFSYHYRYW